MQIREEIEKREEKFLSPYAALSSKTRGRKVSEKECRFRSAFQRDRDRILHCKSFRRLKHKTQVFISPVEDHYRTRLTHTLEVAQIARTLARALRFNEDLTEAIALGHDLGHTPFGHCGEEVLNKILHHYGRSFKHNEQSLRVVEVLERDGAGLNLTYEVRDGILKHTPKDPWPQTLEGVLARLSDRMAYLRHDIEDALRAKVLKKSDLPKNCLKVLGSNILDTIVADIIGSSAGKPKISLSPQVKRATDELYDFLYRWVYTNPAAKSEEAKVPDMLKLLFRHYNYHPENLPGFSKKWSGDEVLQKTVDFIAGMTDRYAIAKFSELFVPDEWRAT